MAIQSHANYIVDANLKPYVSKMQQLKRQTKTMGASVVRQFKMMGASIIAAFGAAGLKSVIAYGTELKTMSEVLQVSVEFIQKWQQANLKNGIAIAQSTVGLQRFVRRVGEAQNETGELYKTLKHLGIGVRDARGELKGTEQILFEFADAVQGTASGAERLAIVFKAFDSEGARMIKTLEGGSAALKRMMADSVVMTEAMAAELAEANVQIETFWAGLKVFVAYVLRGFDYIIGLVPRLVGALSAGQSFWDSMVQATKFTNLFVDQDGIRNMERLQKRIAAQAEAVEHKALKALELEKLQTTEKEKMVVLAQKEADIRKKAGAKELAKLQDAVRKELDRLKTMAESLADRRAGQDSRMTGYFDTKTGMTVEDIASGGRAMANQFGMNESSWQAVRTANQIKGLEHQATGARWLGQDDKAAGFLDRARELRSTLSQLTEGERTPLKAFYEEQAALAKDTMKFHADLITQGLTLRAPTN